MVGNAQGCRRRARRGDGFSLLELMVSIAILLVITGATFSVMSSYQKTYTSTQIKADMYNNLRGVSELMAQEIGQAGLKITPTYPQAQLTTSVVAGIFNTASVTTSIGMQIGNQVDVDQGQPDYERVTITAVTVGVPGNFSALFLKAHSPGATASIVGQGVYSNGVLPPSPIAAPVSTAGSTGSTLELFGDINSNGTLQYVYYSCNPQPQQSPAVGTLARSITPLPAAGNANAPQTMLSTLVVNPNDPVTLQPIPCFRFGTQTIAGGTPFVVNVGVTLSLRTQEVDKTTGLYLVMTKAFLNLTPRNTLGGLQLSEYQLNNFLLPTPAGLPLGCPAGYTCP